MLTLPNPNIAPAARMPIGTAPDALLHVYDGVPDEQEWLAQALSHARACSTPAAAAALELLAGEPLGAPLGLDSERSVRVARVTGLAVSQRDGEPCLSGVGMAHGCCYANWLEGDEGPMLTVELQWPTAFGWGLGKDALALEQLKIRCLRQYELQAVSIIENLADAHLAKGININFDGEWDETTVLFQRRLSQACVARWAQLLVEAQSVYVPLDVKAVFPTTFAALAAAAA